MSVVYEHSVFPDTWRQMPTVAPGRRRGTASSKAGQPVTINHTIDPGLMTLRQVQQYNEAQIPYPNLAGEKAVADRAVQYVRAIHSDYMSRTQAVRRLWKVMDLICQGESLAQLGGIDIVGSHELVKSIERLVVRIEEAMHREDPWFTVRAKQPEFQEDQDEIMGYLLYQLSQAGAKGLWQPLIRDLLAFQVCVVKVKWDRLVEERIATDVEETRNGLSTTYKFTKRKVEALVYDGPRYQQVSPWNLIIDPDEPIPENAEYIGDISVVAMDRLRYMERVGLYKNVDQVREEKRSGTAAEGGGFDQLVSSLTANFAMERSIPHAPKKAKVYEIWGRFDLYGNDNPVECKLTVANLHTCLCAQENPIDGRRKPYGIGRSAKWGREFFNVGTMDIAAHVEEQLDILRSTTQRCTLLGMSPIVFTERNDGPLPANIHEVEPGQVFPGAGKVTPIAVSGDTRAHLPLHQQYQKDIGELTGGPDNFSGTADSNTATESVQNQDQANRKVAGLVRSYSGMWDGILQITHLLNRQYTADHVVYPVMGKAASVLKRHYGKVGPLTFMGDMVFEFGGLQNIYNSATRASGTVQFMSMWGQLLASAPGEVNLVALMRQNYQDLVGYAGEDIFRVRPMAQDVLDQDEENKALLGGRMIAVNELDPHDMHLDKLDPLVDAIIDGRIKDDVVAAAILSHREGHIAGAQRAANEAAVRAKIQQRNAPPAPDSPDAEEGIDGTDALQVAQTPQHETPGPVNGQQQARPGRQQSTSQSQQ